MAGKSFTDFKLYNIEELPSVKTITFHPRHEALILAVNEC
jgi:hypothetical protein